MDLENGASADASLLGILLRDSEEVFVKKLSNNDRDWARFANKHQAGAYIPLKELDGGFFPSLVAKVRAAPDAEEIREVEFPISWPQAGEDAKIARLVNYRSKGEETHLTRLPKSLFATLSPGSYLVIGRAFSGGRSTYRALTIDSVSDDAFLLVDALSLPADFQAIVAFPATERARAREQVLSFSERVIDALLRGELNLFAAEHATMPDTAALAAEARREYLGRNKLKALDPFEIDCPGDAVREISREIELALFRKHQTKSNAIALVRLVAGDTPNDVTPGILLRRLIEGVAEVDALMLSASQQRRSRAGYSFEHHIEALLLAGAVPFEKQVVIEARKRPDFVLPSLRHLRRPVTPVGGGGGGAAGLILSAKTTLRERWKQVQREMGSGDLFLATVDETIAGNAIQDMADMGITLVVPEALKDRTSTAARAAEYRGHRNVLSFRAFFDDVLKGQRLPGWPRAV